MAGGLGHGTPRGPQNGVATFPGYGTRKHNRDDMKAVSVASDQPKITVCSHPVYYDSNRKLSFSRVLLGTAGLLILRRRHGSTAVLHPCEVRKPASLAYEYQMYMKRDVPKEI
jgi:hypothetical protein